LKNNTFDLKESSEENFKRRIAEAQGAIDALQMALDILTENEEALENAEEAEKELTGGPEAAEDESYEDA